MDRGGVERALIHPVLWDPDSNELAIEAVRKYPNRFAVMGWFYLDDPDGRHLVARWKERPGMLGLRFYFNGRHKREWMTDGTLDWLRPAAEASMSTCTAVSTHSVRRECSGVPTSRRCPVPGGSA